LCKHTSSRASTVGNNEREVVGCVLDANVCYMGTKPEWKLNCHDRRRATY